MQKLWTFLFFIFSTNYLFGQSLNISVPQTINVCETFEITLTINNQGNPNIDKPIFTLELPCEMSYVDGSLTSGLLLDKTNKSRPIFELNPISANRIATIKMTLATDCGTYACLNSLIRPFINGSLNIGAKVLNSSSETMNILSPNLVISHINKTFEEVPSFGTFVRKITISNTRTGRVGSFNLVHNFNPHYSIEANQGTVLERKDNQQILQFEAKDFRNIGNGDEYFDPGESIEVEETIELLACQYDVNFVRSDYTVQWGCMEKFCDSSSAIAQIRVVSSTDTGAKISFRLQSEEAFCYDNTIADQTAILQKINHANALENISITIENNQDGRGIIVNSITSKWPFKIEYLNIIENDCGQNLSKKVILSIDRFEATQNIMGDTLNWTNGFCETPDCLTKKLHYVFDLRYKKVCAAPDDTNFSSRIRMRRPNESDIKVLSDLLTPNSRTLSDGQTGFIEVDIDESRFTHVKGKEFLLKMRILKGFVIENFDFAFNSILPTSIEIIENNGYLEYAIVYPLPFEITAFFLEIPFRFDCSMIDGASVTSNKPFASCSCSFRISDYIFFEAIIIPQEDCVEIYRPYGCTYYDYEVNCPNLVFPNVDTLPSAFSYTIDYIGRTSFDSQDKDNNGIEDPIQVPSFNDFDLVRLLPGDTLKINVRGRVIHDLAHQKPRAFSIGFTPVAFISESVEENKFLADLLFKNKKSFKTYNTLLKIKRQETGQIIEITNIPIIYREFSELFILSADSLKNYHPIFNDEFYYQHGDSIWLEINKTLDYDNFLEVKNQLRFEQFFRFDYSTETYVGDKIPELWEKSVCDCFSQVFLIPEQEFRTPSSFVATSFQNTPVCINEFISRSLFNFGFGYFSRIEENPLLFVFPNEIRPIVQIKEVQFSNNNNVDFGPLKIIYGDSTYQFEPLLRQDKVVYITENDLPWSGHSRRFNYRLEYGLRPTGCINRSLPEILDVDILLNRSRVGELYYPEQLQSKLQYQFGSAELKAIMLEPELSAFSENFSTQFDLFFDDNISSIDNAYVRIISTTNPTENFIIRDTRTNDVYLSNNGFYHVGKFIKNRTRRFEIQGTLNTCEPQKIYIEYGFDCEDITDPAIEPCFRALDSIIINFPKGLIDIVPIASSSDDLVLCDTSTQKFTVINAGLGRSYENIIEIDIPSGINYIPNSTKLFYPSGQNQTFIALPDPMRVSPFFYRFDMKNIWQQHVTGLNGAADAPENAFDIEYMVETTCDVVSGSTLNYRVAAKDYCGDILNRVTKVGQKIILNTLTSPEKISLQGNYSGLTKCDKNLANIQYQFTSNSTVPLTFRVRMPQNFSFVANTIVTNLTQPQVRMQNGFLEWTVMPTDRQVNLSFSIANLNEFLCDEYFVEAFIAQSSSAFCEATNEDCDVLATMGQNLLILSPEIFDIDISNIKIAEQAGNFSLSFDIEKLRGNEIQPLKFLLFLDKNGNGQWDAFDTVLDTLLWTDFSASPIFNINPDIQLEDICSLFLLMDKNQNCLCEDKIFPLNNNISFDTEPILLCSGESTELGIESSGGFQYQWNSNVGMSCTRCPSAVFSLQNNTTNIIHTVRTLELSNDNNCRLRLKYNISIPPTLQLNLSNSTICIGDTFRVLSNMASEYLWQGPNITTQNNQELVIAPQENSIYTLTVKDVYGCEYSDTFSIQVTPQPTIEILHNIPFCADSSAQLDIILSHSDNFRWSPRGVLTDVSSLNSGFTTYVDTTLFLDAFNTVCKQSFEIPIRFAPPQKTVLDINICEGEPYEFDGQLIDVSGEYCLTFLSEYGCDSLDCILLNIIPNPATLDLPTTFTKSQFEDLTLTGFEGYASYRWSPSRFLDCDTCAAPITSTTDTITYFLEIFNAANCSARHKVFIDISQKCSLDAIRFPNGFSPNGDGVNDYFSLIFDILCGSMDIIIYNRWGNIVYQMDNWDNTWDGRSLNGEALPQGTYFYNIKLNGLNESVSGMLDLRLK